MLSWFTKTAPIRRKFEALAVSFMLMVLLFCAAGYGMVLNDPPVAYIYVAIYALLGVMPILLVLIAGKLIGDPLLTVATRIETLARGDLTSPVPHVDQRDTIGRLARGVLLFREQARYVVAVRPQLEMIERLERGLERLAHGDLVEPILEPFPPSLEHVRRAFNVVAETLNRVNAVRTDATTPPPAPSQVKQSGPIAIVRFDGGHRTQASTIR